MHRLANRTPFRAELDIFPDARGVDTLVVTVKATFRLGPPLAVADAQAPIHPGDVYWGEPGASSLRYPSERHLCKPGTDILLVGSAHAPGDRPTPSLDVTLVLASIRKVVRVFGDRRRLRGKVGAPEPFLQMPLIYERAFGGPGERRNPVGVGRRGDRPDGALDDEPLPNLEHPRTSYLEAGDASLPTCFAALAPHWSPRCEHAGTYDDAWRRRRAPYLPDDFDPRYFHVAPPSQRTARHLQGRERVELVNASPAPLRFALPACGLAIHARIAGAVEALAPALETVLLEPDDDRLCLLWRAAAPVDRRALEIDEVAVALRNMNFET
jgi:hypothetical protein